MVGLWNNMTREVGFNGESLFSFLRHCRRSDQKRLFERYYRFFRGRRCEDDERQVGRWDRVAGEASGRWRRIYLEKYRKRGVHFIEPNEEEVSPGIRQTLNHWAFDPTSDSLNRFREEKGDLVADEDADEGDDSE